MLEFLASKRVFLVHLTLILLSAWLVFNWYGTVQRLIACYLPVPQMDYWRVVVDYPEMQAHHFHRLWIQHNEHRIVFPEIVFLLDMFLWHGEQFLPLAASFGCYFLIWGVIGWTIWSDGALSRFECALAILLAGSVMGWKGSASALAFPFLLQWTLTQLAAILSLAFLTSARRKTLYLILAIGAAVITTYSSGNGMTLWPVLLLAGLVLKLRRSQMIGLGLGAVASIGLYFVGYVFLNPLDVAKFFHHPLYSIRFLSMYFSMPFGAIESSPTLGVCVGAISLSAVAFLFAYAARKRLLSTRPAVVLFGSYGFALLTAIMAAAGRMDVHDPALTAAKVDRYLTVPLVTWGVLLSLGIWMAARCRWKIASPAVLSFCFALLSIAGCRNLQPWLRAGDADFADLQAAMLSLQNDLDVPSLRSKILWNLPAFHDLLPIIRKNHLSIYFKDRTKWLGQPVRQFHPEAAGFAAGQVTKTTPVPGGLEVFGWADDGRDVPRYRLIVLVNEADRIAGFGERLPAGTAPDLTVPNTPRLLNWVGFANSRVGGSAFRAYLVSPETKCLIPIPGSFFPGSGE